MTVRSDKILLDSEKRIETRDGDRSRPLVVICYPNAYHVGMSNLAFHFLMKALGGRALRVERAFALPQAWKNRAVTFESGEKLSGASAILATFSFEADYVNFLALLRSAGIPLEADARRPFDPLIIAGGSALTANPSVMAPYLDAVAVGEFDAAIDPLAQVLEETFCTGGDREDAVDELAGSPGVLIPRRGMRCDHAATSAARPAKRYEPISSVIVSPYAHFPDTVLVEVNRSCVSSCRFCMASHLYKPFRAADSEGILEACRRWRGRASSVGLIGTAVTSHPDFETICGEIRKMGFGVRLSSVRIEGLEPETLKFISSLGVRSITLAPESAVEAMRTALGKRLPDGDLDETVRVIAESGLEKVKLYFLYGVPGEGLDEVRGIAAFLARIRKSLKPMHVDSSINCLIPKAWTPLQWAPLPPRATFEAKRRALVDACRKMLRETPKLDSFAGVVYQAALSTGGERIGLGLKRCHRSRGAQIREWKKAPGGLDFLFRKKEREEPFPWDELDVGPDKARLYEEYVAFKRAMNSLRDDRA